MVMKLERLVFSAPERQERLLSSLARLRGRKKFSARRRSTLLRHTSLICGKLRTGAPRAYPRATSVRTACRTAGHAAVVGTTSSKCPASGTKSRCTSSCWRATAMYCWM